MSNTTVTITQLPPIGNAFTASTVLPVVQTTGVVSTDQAFLGDMANYILTQAGANLQPAYVANFAYAVTNAAQPLITSLGNLTRLVVTGPAVLQNVDLGNLTINGGNNGQFLQTNGNGVLNWSTAPGAGTGSPGGANTQLQYNLNGSFAGDVHLTWDPSNAKLNTTNINASGNVTATYFIGSGSHLTDLNSGSTIVNGDSNVNVPVSNGNVYINTNAGTAYQWVFDTYGALTLANSYNGYPTITGPVGANIDIYTGGSTYSEIYMEDAGNLYLFTNAETYQWLFDNTGILTLPHGTSIRDTANTALSIGIGAGANHQSANALAIGYLAGNNTQGTEAIAIGMFAGQDTQGNNAVGLGKWAGQEGQHERAIAIGTAAGAFSQGAGAIAIGDNPGHTGQKTNAIAIGNNAGYNFQGANSIAIGAYAGDSNLGNNSIILNATGAVLDQTTDNTFTVKPIRNASGSNILYYDQASGEITYDAGVSGNNAVGVGSFGSDLGVGANYAQNNPSVLFSNDDMVIRTGGTANVNDQNFGQIDIAASEQLFIGLAGNLVDATYIPTGNYTTSIQFPYGGTTVNIVAGTNYLTIDATTGLTYNGNPVGPSIANFVFPNPTSNTSTISVSDGSDIVINPTYGGASPAYINVPGSINGPTSEALQIYNGYFVGNASAAAISIGSSALDGITIYGDGSVVGSANITANYFIGDGSQLSNLPSSGNVGNFAFDSLVLDGTTFDEVTLTGINSGNIIVNAPGLAMVIGGYESGGMVSDGSNTYLFNGDPNFINGIPQPGVGYTWQFDNTGNTILPGAIVGNGNLKLQPDVNTGGAYLDVYLTGGPDIHIAGNGETVILGSDAGANVSVQGAGNVAIQANSVFGGTPHTWMFDYNSNLTLPQLTTINDVSGNGTTLTVGVPPTVIVISGADFSAVNTTYTRDFGQATPTWYPAGYTPGIDSYIMFTGGQYGIYNPGFVPPIYVNTGTLNRPLTQWNLNPPLGSIAPTAVYTYGFTGPAWKFDPTGNLKLPGVLIAQASDNGSIVFSNNGTDNNGSLKVDGGLNMTVSANSNFYVKRAGSDRLAITDTNTDLMASSNVVIHANKAGSEQNWTFDTTGNLRTPGNVDIYGAINFPQQVSSINWSTYNIELSQYGRINTNVDFFANANVIGAQYLKGDGSNISNINASNITNAYSDSNVISLLGDLGGNGISNVGNIDISGNINFTNPGGAIVFADNSVQTTAYTGIAEASFSIQSSNFSANVGGRYGVNTSAGAVTATLPATPATGVAIFFADAGGTYSSNNLTIYPNGQTIMGASGNMTVSTNNQSVGLFYNGTTWRIYNAG